eukprot:Skav233590  [mRNA]  locus=scaffold2520:410301:418958:- [translate_table: standard]
MLAEGAPGALSTAVEQRHKFQIEMAGLIVDTLQDMARRLQGKVDDANAFASKLDAEQETKKAELEKANQVLQEAKDVVTQKTAEYTEAKAAFSEVDQAGAVTRS